MRFREHGHDGRPGVAERRAAHYGGLQPKIAERRQRKREAERSTHDAQRPLVEQSDAPVDAATREQARRCGEQQVLHSGQRDLRVDEHVHGYFTVNV